MILIPLLATLALAGAPHPALAPLDEVYPSLDALYVDLHQHPELSLQEQETAAKLAARLKALGYEVTTGVGGHGVVGVLRNGTGPTVLLRTDMDALPVKEETGLPFASAVTAKNAAGETVPVMHACGHDAHMASWVGAATLLARSRDRWRGTLVLVGQPAEELLSGARAMIADGLLTRFPRPDFALALHSATVPSGKVALVPGYIYANVNDAELTVYGTGGHGAMPNRTVDPIVIAARIVVTLQTIVSREVNPFDPAVVTVGSIHGGTKSNIIPEEVKLQLTIRSYKDEVQDHLVSAIGRIARAEAVAGRSPKDPMLTVGPRTASILNDAALGQRLTTALSRWLGPENVIEGKPVMASEDFTELGRAGVPTLMFWLGAAEPKALAAATAAGKTLPGPHSPRFAPVREPTIRTGASAMTLSALELLGKVP
jgi:hippurate hydrolase